MRTYVVINPNKQTEYLETYTEIIIKNETYYCNRAATNNKFRKTRGKIQANKVQTVYGPITDLTKLFTIAAFVCIHCTELNTCSQM